MTPTNMSKRHAHVLCSWALVNRIGTTKIFIRDPKTLFDIEARFQKERHNIATKIQAKVKGHLGRKHFLLQKSSGEGFATLPPPPFFAHRLE